MSWRAVVGALAGGVAAVVWAVSLAIYQPYMQPAEADVGGNNTYWPRDIRQLSILLAFLGVLLICRPTARAIFAGGVMTFGWGAADLVLDRFDVSGGVTAAGLAGVAVAVFAGIVAVARREASHEYSGHFPASVAAVLGAVTLLLTTPWDEPVVDPDDVRVENALSLLKAGLVIMFAAAAVGLLRLKRWKQMVPFGGLAALAVWPATAAYGWLGALGLILLPAAAATAVAAARRATLPRLLVVLAACAVALIPAYLLLYFIGSSVGGAMTYLAGNPPINSADSDLSLAFAALILGLLFAMISHTLTPRPQVLVEVAA